MTDKWFAEYLELNRKKWATSIWKRYPWIYSQDIEDIIQNAFLNSWRSFKKNKKKYTKQQHKKYVFIKLYQEAKEYMRQKDKNFKIGLREEYRSIVEQNSEEGSIFERLSKREDYEVAPKYLLSILFLTTKKKATILHDFYLRDMSHKDLAKYYKVTVGTIKKMLSDGRSQIRDRLEDIVKTLNFIAGKQHG